MRKTDISRYTGAPVPNGRHPSSGTTAKKTAGIVFSTIFKIIGSILLIMFFTGIIVGSSVLINIFKMADNTVDVDLHTLKLDLTSFIYVNDENGNPVEYQSVYAGESRIWVDYDNIPEAMKNAIIAIEDKRFYDHKGVDWIRTGGAVLNLATGGGNSGAGGGSTLTQQLIKNLTNRNDVSITRKVTEIFSALEFEKRYSKSEILEAYLNVVNFGSGTNGVQAAAKLYFNKDIKDCSIAQCAAIAAIPNNPVWYTPLVYPENNKERRENILDQMHQQGMITQEEYDQAMQESAAMTFVGYTDDNVVDNVPIDDWYVEAMLNDVAEDLAEALNVDEDNAMYMLMHNGYKIYSAMDVETQRMAEEVLSTPELMPPDEDIQFGYVMMEYDGRVLASVGQRGKKEGNQLWDFTTSDDRLPASSFKPLSAYAPAIDKGLLNYSSLVLDQPLKNIPGTEGEWPPNWYTGYKGQIPVEYALEISSNAAAAQTVNLLGLENSFDSVSYTHLRKNQKLIEESPSPAITQDTRQRMIQVAAKAAKTVGYVGAGTIEFLYDQSGNFYFMEMNTRLQVEHPVTEMVTGIDLVQWQIRVAAGIELSFSQEDIQLKGHAIECRVNAEDPAHGFRPSCGQIQFLHIPGGPGVRFETAVYPGYFVPPFYDSMIGKLVVHGDTRDQAIRKMKTALGELVIEGISHNAELQMELKMCIRDRNNTYLQANSQEDGVQSYGRMVDLLLADQRQKRSK